MQKKLFGAILALCLLLGMLMALPAVAADVIEIGTVEELLKLMNEEYALDGDYELTADIHLDGISGQSSIGSGTSTSTRFTGTFNGNNHEITGLKISGGVGTALFGNAGSGATIENLKISGEVTATGNGSGALVGYCAGSITIINCTTDVAVDSSASRVGAIIGAPDIATDAVISVTGCKNLGEIKGSSQVGGILGYAKATTAGGKATVTNCVNEGAVSTKDTGSYAGGIVGYYHTNGKENAAFSIISCTNKGTVTVGGGYTGGIIGAVIVNKDGNVTIDSCVNEKTAAVKSCGFSGGIAGRLETSSGSASTFADKVSVTNCSNYAPITGQTSSDYAYVGGIVGMLTASRQTITLDGCYNAGSVTGASAGTSATGGIVGYMRSYYADGRTVVTNCQNVGAVSSAYGYVGGVAGGAYQLSSDSVQNMHPFVTTNVNAGTVTVSGNAVLDGVVGAEAATDITNLITATGNYAMSDNGWVNDAGEKVTTFADLSSLWVITANGPELKAFHTVHVYEYLNDKQHKCGCGDIADHVYEDKVCLGCDFDQPVVELTSGKVVYVKENGGSDANDGSSPDAAFQTLTKAYQALKENGGTIVICDTVTLDQTNALYAHLSKSGHSYYAAPKCSGAVKITSKYDAYDFTGSAVLKLSLYVLRSDHIFDDITLENATTAAGISALGNDLLIGKNVKCNAYSGGQYPMILSGLFEVNAKALYFADTTDTIVWNSTSAPLWSGNTTNSIVTDNYQTLAEGADGDGVQDIVINGGTWRTVKGGNFRAGSSSAYGTLDHVLNITINDGKIVGFKDSIQNSALGAAYSSVNGSANMTINGGTFENCAVYLFGRNGVSNVKTIEGNHSLTINGGTFNGYCLIAGAQGADNSASASSSTALPTDTTSNLKASGTCTITISGGNFGKNVAVKTTATGNVSDVFTGDNASLDLVVSTDVVDALGDRIDMIAFSSRTDYDTDEEYCEINGHNYKKNSDGKRCCTACGVEQKVTNLTLTALDPRDKTFTFNIDAPDVEIDFDDIVVVKDGDKWVASGYTLVGADGYYVLKNLTFELTDVDGDIMIVTANETPYEVYYGQSITLTAVDAPEGYRFDGWYEGETLVSTAQEYTISSVKSDITLVTSYTWISDAPEPEPEPEKSSNNNIALAIALACRNNQKCVVTYKSTGAGDHVSSTVKKGTVLTMPEAPTKDGYTFIGWYKDINGTKPFDFNAKITGSVSIYAKWVKN